MCWYERSRVLLIEQGMSQCGQGSASLCRLGAGHGSVCVRQDVPLCWQDRVCLGVNRTGCG